MKTVLTKIKGLEDYSLQEVSKFDEMHQVLKAYNAKLGTPDEMPLPQYSKGEMSDYSGYRELLIARECED